jgi:hypothetical protein
MASHAPCQEREALKLDSLGIPFPDHLNNEFFPLSYLDLIVLCSLCGAAALQYLYSEHILDKTCTS